jgi:hypothetical protein
MSSSIALLPDAVVLVVLSFLDRNDLLSAASVDSLLLRLSRDDISWQTSWAHRAGILRWRRAGASLRACRVYCDPILSGGLPLWQLSALQPLRMPTSLVHEPLRKLALQRVGGVGVRGAFRAVRFVGSALGANRAIVADCAFPRVEWRRATPSDAFHLPVKSASVLSAAPFAWAPPLSAAQRLGSGGAAGGAVGSAARREDGGGAAGGTGAGSTIFLAGAYVVAYFEVGFTIEDGAEREDDGGGGERQERSPSAVSVGLVAKEFPLMRMPGWDANSFGYHSDDGQRFHNSPFGAPFGPLFGPDDVVGCGLVYSNFNAPGVAVAHSVADSGAWTSLSAAEAAAAWPSSTRENGGVGDAPGTIFYTLNGRMVGPAFNGVDTSRAWFPCVGIDSRMTSCFNFGNVPGEPFVFNIRDFNAGLLERLPLPSISSLPLTATSSFVRNSRSQVLPHLRTSLAPPPPPTARVSGGQPSPPRDNSASPPPPPHVAASALSIFLNPQPSTTVERSANFATRQFRAAMRDRQYQQLVLHRVAVVLAAERVDANLSSRTRDSEDEGSAPSSKRAPSRAGAANSSDAESESRGGWRLRSLSGSDEDGDSDGGSDRGSTAIEDSPISMRQYLLADWLRSVRTEARFSEFLRRAIDEILASDRDELAAPA